MENPEIGHMSEVHCDNEAIGVSRVLCIRAKHGRRRVVCEDCIRDVSRAVSRMSRHSNGRKRCNHRELTMNKTVTSKRHHRLLVTDNYTAFVTTVHCHNSPLILAVKPPSPCQSLKRVISPYNKPLMCLVGLEAETFQTFPVSSDVLVQHSAAQDLLPKAAGECNAEPKSRVSAILPVLFGAPVRKAAIMAAEKLRVTLAVILQL
ncbi:hypothetical protein BaRGS_00012243 [Batillaria attramentaria]|uniref:Uncharacterized protein n=1 Tax=Batillaria attramentaria TaxID=370345 RepID=A0ABD0LBT7_9CAEN